jgi:hypothetical protein
VGLGSRRVIALWEHAKGVGMPMGYTRFVGACTRLAAETLAATTCYEVFVKAS